MVVPVRCDVICAKLNVGDQQSFEEMMLTCGMSYRHAKFPAISMKHSYEGTAIYYDIHQVNNDRKQELAFWRKVSKDGILVYTWTVSSEDLQIILERNGVLNEEAKTK